MRPGYESVKYKKPNEMKRCETKRNKASEFFNRSCPHKARPNARQGFAIAIGIGIVLYELSLYFTRRHCKLTHLRLSATDSRLGIAYNVVLLLYYYIIVFYSIVLRSVLLFLFLVCVLRLLTFQFIAQH